MSDLPIEFESRRETVMRGLKEGALKTIVDKMVGQVSGPIMQSIAPKFKESFPEGAHLLEPAVQGALEFAFIMGIAELIMFAAPAAGRVMPSQNPEDLAHKTKLLATWMRKYAGERVGEGLVEAAAQVFPMIMDQFSSVQTSDLSMILNESVAAVTPAVQESAIKFGAE